MSWPATPKFAFSLDTARYPVITHQKIIFKKYRLQDTPGAGLKEAVDSGIMQCY